MHSFVFFVKFQTTNHKKQTENQSLNSKHRKSSGRKRNNLAKINKNAVDIKFTPQLSFNIPCYPY